MHWTTKIPIKEGWYWVTDYYYDGFSKIYVITVFNTEGKDLNYWSRYKKCPISVTLIDNPRVILRKWSNEPTVLPEGESNDY